MSKVYDDALAALHAAMPQIHPLLVELDERDQWAFRDEIMAALTRLERGIEDAGDKLSDLDDE